jgi:high-affinity Fe2+/Pb2+ permease
MNKNFIKILSFILLFASLGMIVMGLTRSHKVYSREMDLFFYKVSDRRLVVDTTFSGIIRDGDKLYTTYDRSQDAGRRSCPT